jgi:hypothetical protein
MEVPCHHTDLLDSVATAGVAQKREQKRKEKKKGLSLSCTKR